MPRLAAPIVCLSVWAGAGAVVAEIQQPKTLKAAAAGLNVDTDVTPTGLYCDHHGEDASQSGEPGVVVCCPRRVTAEVTRKCWLVKPEWVCIPRFRWPWECGAASGSTTCGDGCGDARCPCRPPKCGKVRSSRLGR